MSSFRLAPASSLGSFSLPPFHRDGGAPGVTLSERTGLALCSVVIRKGAEALLVDRVREAFSVELPLTPRYTGVGPVAFVWIGPGQWLAIGTAIESQAFEAKLKSSLAGAASVADQSDGRTVLRIGGARAADALAKGLPVDLHPSAFGPGSAATTVAAYVGVHVWQVDAAPTYEIAMFRSFAVSFCEWLADAAAEYGVESSLLNG